MFETGRLCVKKSGKETGKYCVILENLNEHEVMITGPKSLTGVKKRKCNINHLEPTDHVLDISKSTSDESIAKQMEKLDFIKEPGKKVERRERKEKVKQDTKRDIKEKQKEEKKK